MKFASYVSCIVGSGASEITKVVDWEGNLRHHELLTTVAELMLEAPGHMIVCGEEAERTRRAVALKADERLRAGGVYLLCPVDRAGSRLPEYQMAAVESARRGGKRRRAGKGRGLPASNRVFPGLVASEQRKETRSVGDAAGLPRCPPVGAARRWKPVLESIRECKESDQRRRRR